MPKRGLAHHAAKPLIFSRNLALGNFAASPVLARCLVKGCVRVHAYVRLPPGNDIMIANGYRAKHGLPDRTVIIDA